MLHLHMLNLTANTAGVAQNSVGVAQTSVSALALAGTGFALPYSTLFALSVVVLASLSGAFVLLIPKQKYNIFQNLFISFGAGVMLALIFVDFLPEVVEHIPAQTAGLLIILGILISFVTEKLLCWRHCHYDGGHSVGAHTQVAGFNGLAPVGTKPHISALNLIGDLVHNVIHGIIIANAFFINPALGYKALLSVLSHEIPQELADVSILLHSGLSKRKALLLNFGVSLFTFAGAFITRLPINQFAVTAVVSGILLYIALADILADLHHIPASTKTHLLQLLMILVGVLTILVV